MTALPMHGAPDPDDPAEILRVLPERYRAEFEAEYLAALDEARSPEQYRVVPQLLRLWRLRAALYSSPGHDERREAARTAGPDDVPLEQLIAEHNKR